MTIPHIMLNVTGHIMMVVKFSVICVNTVVTVFVWTCKSLSLCRNVSVHWLG